MKKLIAIFLLTFYTATTFGLTLNFHYCGGTLDQVSILNLGDKDACSCILGAMSKDCCQDKVVYQKTDDHKKINESYSFNEIGLSYHLAIANDHNKYNLLTPNENKSYSIYRFRRDNPFPIYLFVRSLRI